MFAGIIRPLTENDIGAVETILDLYWTGDFRQHISERLHDADSGIQWLVAEEAGEIVGVTSSRLAPERMRTYATSDNVVELYVGAAKYKGKGIGTALRNASLADARNHGYAEAVFFSGESHKDSWAFHDQSDFRRVGEATAPDGEKGHIWLMDLR